MLSNASKVTSGVPQGSVLGPVLFLIFINDICDLFTNLNVKCKLFADDLKLYANRSKASLASELSIALERIEVWCQEWQLNLAIDKCSVLLLGPRPDGMSRVDYKLYNESLNYCQSIKDLGVVIDCRLSFNEHISIIARKALIRCKLILKCFCSRNVDLLVKAFITYVRPLLEFGSSVWSPHHQYLISKLEKVQRFFTKRIPGMWNLSYEQRLASLKLHSLEIRRKLSDLSLCYKLVNGNTVDTYLSTVLG
jgi:hypothetical protein